MFALRAQSKHAFRCETEPAVPWLALLGAPARRATGVACGGGAGADKVARRVTGGAQIEGAASVRRAPKASI